MEVCGQSMQWRPSQRAQLLAPFDHQVAGQSSMLVYDATTLCKPLIPREHFVYQTLPAELQEFTPQYRGEILVKLQEKEGNIQLVGHAVGAAEIGDQTSLCSTDGEPDPKTKDCGSSSGVSSEQRNSFTSDASQAYESTSSEASAAASYMYLANEGVDPCATSVSTMSSAASHLHPQTHNLNPWSMKNHKRLLEKMRKSSHRSNKTRFMLLGNVVAGFKKPCILDLKIGSRLHGDDASSTKVASQTSKCSQTTSSSLGVRLCGMQVYQVTSDTYLNLDKFHGRMLTVETFQHTLRDFLHNGAIFRKELLQPIISRLAALISCVRRLDTYRFYASSLLIMYDGEVEQEPSSLLQSDLSQHLKSNLYSIKQRPRGQEIRNKVEDRAISDADAKRADSKPRRVKSADQICVQIPKLYPVSVAAAPSIQSIYDSTSIASVPAQSNVSPLQEEHQVQIEDSYPMTKDFSALDKNQPVALDCQAESANTTIRVLKASTSDCLNMSTLSYSYEPKNCSSAPGSLKNTFAKVVQEDKKDLLTIGLNQTPSKCLSHSCEVTSSEAKHQEYAKTPYSSDCVAKNGELGNISSLESSGEKHEDASLSAGEFSNQDCIFANPVMKKCQYVDKNDAPISLNIQSQQLLLYDSNQLSEAKTIGNKAAEQNLMSGKAYQSIDRLKVDIKMIDFAHTTHSGFESDKIKHCGPDVDYITGLENLKCLFECLCSHQDFG